jgi:hypothetical protein
MIRHLVCIDAKEGVMRRYEQRDGKLSLTATTDLPDRDWSRSDSLWQLERFRQHPADYLRDLPTLLALAAQADPYVWVP